MYTLEDGTVKTRGKKGATDVQALENPEEQSRVRSRVTLDSKTGEVLETKSDF